MTEDRIVKVAITGTHGVGKTFIVDNVAAMAQNEGWNAEVINSPTRRIKEVGAPYGLDNNWDGSDWRFQLQVSAQSQFRLWDVEQRVLADLPYSDGRPTLIIADRCLYDPVAYTQDLIDRIDATQISDPAAYTRKQYLQMVHTLGLTLAQEDTFFDQVFYKPHHPDYLEADPDRLDDREYQLAIEGILTGLLPSTVTTCDIDRNVACDEVWDWIAGEQLARAGRA